VAGSLWTTIDAMKRQEAWTQAMWLGFYLKQDIIAKEAYYNEPSADAVGALLSHVRWMNDERKIICMNPMIGTNNYLSATMMWHGRLAKLYRRLDRQAEAQVHLTMAAEAESQCERRQVDPAKIVKAIDWLDSNETKWKTNQANKVQEDIVNKVPSLEY